MPSQDETTGDVADVAVAQWRRERPDLDLTAMGPLARFARLNALGSRRVDAVFARHGIDRGEFDVLAGLRRVGAPYEMTPSRLAAALLVTRAGMTKRIDRLERRGLVTRRQVPADRRSMNVGLTGAGLSLIDAAVTEHVRNENALLALLTPAERAAFDGVLRTLLGALEDDESTAAAGPDAGRG